MYEYFISGGNNNMQANYQSEAIAPTFLDDIRLTIQYLIGSSHIKNNTVSNHHGKKIMKKFYIFFSQGPKKCHNLTSSLPKITEA